jgi:ribonuclease HI
VGEALASYQAVNFCKELGLSSIILEGDAQVIVSGINTSNRNWSKLGHIIEDIRIVLQLYHTGVVNM